MHIFYYWFLILFSLVLGYDLFTELKLATKVRINELHLYFKRANHYRITYFLCTLHLRYTDIKKCLTKNIKGHEEE